LQKYEKIGACAFKKVIKKKMWQNAFKILVEVDIKTVLSKPIT